MDNNARLIFEFRDGHCEKGGGGRWGTPTIEECGYFGIMDSSFLTPQIRECLLCGIWYYTKVWESNHFRVDLLKHLFTQSILLGDDALIWIDDYKKNKAKLQIIVKTNIYYGT